jgi:hypothetical protein
MRKPLEIMRELHSIEDSLDAMDARGWMKWLMFDTSQLAHWISVRRSKVRELRRELELAREHEREELMHAG